MNRIVIVDDSGTARMFIRKCLEIAGCAEAEFHEASDGQQALEIVEERTPDLVVTDLTMPGMDGMALLKALRGDPRWNEVPVVVITSAKNPAREDELRRSGAAAVLAKPVSPAVMMSALEAL